jgi:hypothetical protein
VNSLEANNVSILELCSLERLFCFQALDHIRFDFLGSYV